MSQTRIRYFESDPPHILIYIKGRGQLHHALLDILRLAVLWHVDLYTWHHLTELAICLYCVTTIYCVNTHTS